MYISIGIIVILVIYILSLNSTIEKQNERIDEMQEFLDKHFPGWASYEEDDDISDP